MDQCHSFAKNLVRQGNALLEFLLVDLPTMRCWHGHQHPLPGSPGNCSTKETSPKTSMDGRHPQENTAGLAMLKKFLFQSHVFCPTFQTSLFQTQVFPILAVTM
jgi:hypothetical protein